jgi:hypothetical protein
MWAETPTSPHVGCVFPREREREKKATAQGWREGGMEAFVLSIIIIIIIIIIVITNGGPESL